MKKFLVLMTMAAFVVLAAAPAAMAAAALGPHQLSTDNNPCKICHDTASGTPALRGWAGGEPVAFGDWGDKPISALCSSCHDNTGGNIPGQLAHNMVDTAYNWAGGSHGYTIPNVPPMPEGTAQDATSTNLPYTNTGAAAELECTSCHNVHVSTARPFNQRADIPAMCEECHLGRSGGGMPASQSYQPTGAARAYSTHPVDVNMGTTPANRTMDTVASMGADFKNPVGDITTFAWQIGGHLNGITDTGGGATGPGIDCQTCHAVHGPTGVPEIPVGLPGWDELLAYNNNTPAAVAGPGSLLCEGCHGNVSDGTQVGVATGATDEDHPMDARDAYMLGATAALPASWSGPVATGDRGAQPFVIDAGAGNAGQPACSSCHDTHGGIEDSMLLRGPDEGITPASMAAWTPASYNTWCFSCHDTGNIIPPNHHSVYQNMNTSAVTATNPGGANEFLSQLTCSDCHGNSITGYWTAHNGFWSFPVAITSTDSDFCEECHTLEDPTVPEAVAFGVAGFPKKVFNVDGAGRINTLPASHGTIRAVGAAGDNGVTSHQTDLGADSASGTPNMDFTPDWTSYNANSASEWGPSGTPANSEPICESCHGLLNNGVTTAGGQGLMQGWRTNLLLAPYEDDTAGVAQGEAGPTGTDHDWYTDTAYVAGAAAGNTGVNFCRVCHEGTAAGNPADFVHNPAAHTQDYTTYVYPVQSGLPTQPYGRTVTTIMTQNVDHTPAATCPNASTADTNGAPGVLSYPDVLANGAINCDSCHRPHNANALSWDSGVIGTHPTTANRGNRYLILETTDNNWGTTICTECHDTNTQCN